MSDMAMTAQISATGSTRNACARSGTRPRRRGSGDRADSLARPADVLRHQIQKLEIRRRPSGTDALHRLMAQHRFRLAGMAARLAGSI